MAEKFINIACGNTFILDHRWVNLDYAPAHPSIQQANLLDKLPFADESVDTVYSSHFIEHIPRHKLPFFLQECRRILKPNGYVRFVMPDLENICREYLTRCEQGEYDKAYFAILEMIDQNTRNQTGGLLSLYYERVRKERDREKAEYIRMRTGEIVIPVPHTTINYSFINKIRNSVTLILWNPRKAWARLRSILSSGYIHAVTALLPKAFREQNVSFTTIGEKHAWMWDFYTFAQELENAGFRHPKRMQCNTTSIEGFPLVPLDIDQQGQPRKGLQSMYIEAIK